jgi:hypothetical protein
VTAALSGSRTDRATRVSLALNPSVWDGAFAAFLALRFAPSPRAAAAYAGLAFLSVAAVPVGLLFVLRAAGRLSDVEMRDRGQRRLVYLACSASYAAGGAALWALGAPWPVWGIVVLHVPIALVLAALNGLWKVSIHTAGLAGLAAAGLVLFGMPAVPLAALPLLGGWARWEAGAHTAAELVLGAVVGFVTTGAGMAALQHLSSGPS